MSFVGPYGTFSEHGLSGYSAGCRCYTCGWGQSEWDRKRTLAIRRGTWKPFVPIGPVLTHLRTLTAAGMGRRRIGELSGINQRNVQRILAGGVTKLRPVTADRLLAVTVAPSGRTLIDSTGSRRRIEALCAAGWSLRAQAAEVGWLAPNYHRLRTSPTIQCSTARMVSGVYDAWSMRVPEPSRSSSWAVGHALRAGWFLPLAWDDDTIDDPAAFPVLMPPLDDEPPHVDELAIQHRIAGHDWPITRAGEVELIRRCRAAEWLQTDIARAIGRTVDTVRRRRAEQ